MCRDLGIRIIAASSPQAKGRVERAHGTHQDRLVKKLRVAGIAGYDDANRYLDDKYLADHNRRYARAAASQVDYHRRRPTARQLDAVFWLEEERVVSADWVVSYKTRLLQLERQMAPMAPRQPIKSIGWIRAAADARGGWARLGCGPHYSIHGDGLSNRKQRRSQARLHNSTKGTFLLSARRGHF